ncbi:hypothetical protein C0995_003414 [Termitomyces sp. Mi166|nr:hypothetical protein C0995_003414 [Termitomyces sp. Mi166\
MKFTTIFATLATLAISVSALPGETNAQRMARGLPPLPPVRRATPVDVAKRATPSKTPTCSSGSTLCCNSLSDSSNPLVKTLAGLLGAVLLPTVGVGLTCSSLRAGATCSQQTVCCQNNNFNGLIAIGCSPITINL